MFHQLSSEFHHSEIEEDVPKARIQFESIDRKHKNSPSTEIVNGEKCKWSFRSTRSVLYVRPKETQLIVLHI